MILIVLKHFLKHISLDRHFHVCFYGLFLVSQIVYSQPFIVHFHILFCLVLLYSALDHIHMYFALYKLIIIISNEQRFIFCQKRRTLPFVVRNEQRFQNRYSNIFQFRAYDRFLCSQSLHGIVRNQERVSQAYETSVSKKRLHTKRTTLHFVVGNEQRFPLLLGTNNALRIFMVLSETKSALVIKISQRYCLLRV